MRIPPRTLDRTPGCYKEPECIPTFSHWLSPVSGPKLGATIAAIGGRENGLSL